jgi:hypothetical protein
MKHTVTHRFKRGQQLQLDDIYLFSGLGDDVAGVGKWWEPNDEAGEELTVTKDIEITVTIRTPNAHPHGRAPARTVQGVVGVSE